MITATPNEMRALIHLLCAEESRTNTELVRQKLLELGTPCVPVLEDSLEHVDANDQERIESVLQEIRWKEIGARFQAWAAQGGDLEEGVFLLAQFSYPKLEVQRYQGILDQMAREARLRIKSLRRPAEVVGGLTQYLFYEMGFHGNTIHYYHPDNSYINRVIDQRVGIPITLSIVMLLVAKRLRLPLVGVGLPGHFVVRYEKKTQEIYIDAFNLGRVLTKEDCIKMIHTWEYHYREESFRAATPSEMLVRMMRNLIFIYHQLKETEKANWLSHYVSVIS
jgi:regulator of sirC expression with transglutaminase-like and TPR domain